MKLPWRRNEVSRGQAMVEFAVILPVLALLLVMAVDFGRVFYGWVALQNATRVGANQVGLNPDDWTGTGNAAGQAEYRRLIIRELSRMNCLPPSGTDWASMDPTSAQAQTDIPNPQFTTPAGTTTTTPQIGDHASVALDCRFSLITPLAGNLLGNPMTIKAEADFAVRGGLIAGVPIGPAPPSPQQTCSLKVVPNLVGNTVSDARAIWTGAGFSGVFLPGSGPDDTDIVTAQGTNPTTSPGDCVAATTSMQVQHQPSTACPSGQIRVPNVLNITVAAARTKWTAAGFTGSFLPATGFDTDLVSSQSTSTGKGPGECSITSTLITVGHAAQPGAFCTTPDMSGLSAIDAEAKYRAAGFSGTFKSTGPNDGLVSGQSPVGGSSNLCSSNASVTLKK
jgi:hypothetical protein